MDIKEFYVQDRMAIAITSMTGIGDTIYLGLTGSSHSLSCKVPHPHREN